MSIYLIQTLTGLASAAILFLVSAGLTLIFGALRVINFAHGALYMLGAFLSLTVAGWVGSGNATFFVTVLLTSLAVGGVGILMEMTIMRRIYPKPVLNQLLVTFGFVLVISGLIREIYGSQPRLQSAPPALDGSVSIVGRPFPVYELFLIALAAIVAIGLWALLYRTRLGRMIRAAVDDPELLELAGGDVRLLYTGVFALGCFLAGLAGAVVAPLGAVGLGIDVDVVLKAFVIVVVGGLGSLSGALVGSVLVGVAGALGILLVPQASLAIIFAVLVVVLALRPQGLFGNATQ